MLTELFEIKRFIFIEMDLVLNNLQCAIKPNQTKSYIYV